MRGQIVRFGRRWIRRCVFTLALAAGELLSAGQPLFPEGCNLVLLAGLPGDLESEETYRQQLQAWLDVVSARARPAGVFALSDSSEAIKSPPNLPFRALKNDRKSFLDLAATLNAKTNPLVVIAWGHGGRQGAANVFHVRGPRLTPADIATLAADTPDSQWLLAFRGSGAFAKQLAGKQRRVISSDADYPFNNDPIGMSLLLKLAQGGAVGSFESLATELGRSTLAWYQERGLARTEEPVLWAGTAAPRLLALSSDATPDAKPSTPVAAVAPPPGPPKDQTDTAEKVPAAIEPASPELTGSWKEIKKVDPAAYPESDAVILKQGLSCTLGSNPALVIEREQFVQVLTPEGKTRGDFDISYAPPEEEIEFQDCEVLGPDGKVARLDPDRIGEAGEPAPADYARQKRKFFSLPGVVPGAVVHVKYRSRWEKFPLPQVSMSLPIAEEVPSLHSILQVSLPKDAAFHWAFEGVAAPDPVLKNTTYATSYKWEFGSLPAQRREILSSPISGPRLHFSTFQNWRAFAEWYERISRLTDEVTPEIRAKAAELTVRARSDREKVQALYNYVTALRYVAVPLGINSVRPHAAANVLKNQFGDCKDKANLLNAMLHSLDIDAHLVLVPRFSQAHDAVPGLAFNHAISRVKTGGDILWLDTTDDVCRFGMLPPGDNGRKVLVVDGQTDGLIQLPAADPKDHRLLITGHVQSSQKGEPPCARLKAIAVGYPDYELRAAAREARDSHASLPLLAARFRPVDGSFALERQKATPVSALEEDFSWEAEGTYLGLTSTHGFSRELHSPFWIPHEWELALHRRHGPLYLNHGYPLLLDQSFEIRLAGKPESVTLPEVRENSQGPLRWRVEWARIGDDKLEVRLKAELEGGELSVDQSSAFQQQVQSLLEALAGGARVNLPRSL